MGCTVKRMPKPYGESRKNGSTCGIMHIVFLFASARHANRLVAGVPAAARLAHVWCLAEGSAASPAPLRLAVADGGSLDHHCLAEIARLASGTWIEQTPVQTDREIAVAGESLPDAAALRGWQDSPQQAARQFPPLDEAQATRALAAAHRRIVKATGKAGDGIVSRWLNRPISQAMSRQLLRLDWIRPGHATALTALAALAMFACLVLGGQTGLIAGALLFQGASIIDGVDGEIARATFRSSARGAALDSGIDAATNLGFIAGIIINRWQDGAMGDVLIGLSGIGIMITGLAMLGLYAVARGEPLNFDGAKKLLGDDPTRLQIALRYITMRDFYCLFFVVMVVAGLLPAALMIFAIAALLWLFAITVMLARDVAATRGAAPD